MSLGGLFSKRGDAAIKAAFGSDSMRGDQFQRADAKHRLELLDQFEDACLGWFWATNAEGQLIYISESAARKLDSTGDEMIGRSLSSLFIPDHDDREEMAERPLAFLLSARNSIQDMPVRVAKDGNEAWWSISGKPQLDKDGNFQGYRGSAKDITAVRQTQRDASRLAQYDSLTGLANRHRMSKRLTAMLTAYKSAKRSCALMMLDLDRFKQVNDTLGHPAGDELLKQVAQRLERIIGKSGEIGRLGGDEFQIILPDLDDRGDLGSRAERVIQMISQPYSINGSRAIIGTSVGIAIAPYDGLEAEELVGAADLALYAAKGGGRGQFRFYSAELKDGARLRRQIEEDLRDALETNQLKMQYQPVVKAKTNKVAACEALMRWEHPERGWISPADFIPVAEETNLISDLGQFALRQACLDAAQWPGEIRVAVNVSAVQFMSEDLPDIVRRALKDSGLEPNRLELEITESVFIGDEVSALEMFQRLKKIGVRLALDDFGTGYSSLGYLRNAPFDKIKIDQSFVRGLTEPENNNSAIITAIISLASALKMDVVAEGVEAMDELDLLRELGVCHIQGYVYSKAIHQSDLQERFVDGQLECEPNGPAKHRAERKTVFRRIGVIHEDHHYEAVMRNLSRSGARIEGLLDVPLGTSLVLDLGEGQLAVATVRRSDNYEQGLEFEAPLVNDGAGGLCTRHRVSPYALAAAGMPLTALPAGDYPLVGAQSGRPHQTSPAFIQIDISRIR